MASTAADYRDRRADLLAFRGIFPSQTGREQLLAQQFVRPGDGGVLIAGIQKLAQKVLLILLTEIGSRVYAPTEGTAFMIDARRGFWRTPADVEQSFYSARLDVLRQCQASEDATDPDDERWSDLVLDGVTLAGDKVTIRMTLTSRAGRSYTFLTPISVPIK